MDPGKPGRSGLSDIVWEMASELVNQGHEAHVVASYHTDRMPDDRVIVHNFATPPIGYRNIIGQVWILKRAADCMSMIQPDVIHAPEYLSIALFASIGLKPPMVLTVPGNIYHRLSIKDGSSYEWYFAQILKWAARKAAKMCGAVLAISQEMKWWWERTGSPPERTPVIPLGGDAARFTFQARTRERLSIPEDRLVFLYVGRFAKEKGLGDLINAVADMDERAREKVLVYLIGQGPWQFQLEDLIRVREASGTISILPWVDRTELATWYSAADALVLPSYTEGLSRTIIEAMLCGTPVIGSRISGTEDHVHEGQNGFLFPAGNRQALTRILEYVADHPDVLADMRSFTATYAKETFSWNRIVSQIVECVYRPLMRGDLPTAFESQNWEPTGVTKDG